MCGVCDIENIAEVDEFTEADYDRIIHEIIVGIITVYSLDYATYSKTAKLLTQGVFKGYGKTITEVGVGSTDYKMLFDLRQNVHIFSAAKTYQQTRAIEAKLLELNQALTEGDRIKSFEEFRKDAKKILVDYNKNYLRTEYNSAILQSTSASRWVGFEENKHLYPNLTYHTVGDQRVRYSHAILDGITRPVGDKFWNKVNPQNDWGCRCMLLPSDSEVKVSEVDHINIDDHVNPVFQFNPGKARRVFSPKHPYFDVAPKDKDWAKQNFGLPLYL